MKLYAAVVLFAMAAPLYAGDVSTKEMKEAVIDTPFDKGKMEFQISSGVMTSLFNYGPYRPKITDVDASLRLGWMLYTPRGEGCLRGNLEFLLEAEGALTVQGPKTGLTGADLMLRYNFVQPDARFVPYLQVAGGGVYTDIDHDQHQHFIGRDEEFYLGVGLGAHWFFSKRCALSIEADYRHISNANTADRNIGLNSVGGMLGLSCYF